MTVVIPVFGQEFYLDKCLRSIQEFGPECNVIVVNDCSPRLETYDYFDLAKREFPFLRVVHNTENLGFSKTVNKGVSLVEDNEVLILNSDIEFVDNGAIQHSLEQLKRGVGIVGIRLHYEDGTIQHAGRFVKGNEDYTRGRTELPREEFCKIEEVPIVTGAYFMLRKSVFDKVGGFPNIYGKGYYEDMDFVCSLVRAGYKIVYDGEVWAYHYANKSFQEAGHTFDHTENKKLWLKRNKDVIKKWL